MLENKDVTEKIIGCAYKVYNKMGFGFSEKVYVKCLCMELEEAGIHVAHQQPVPVRYRGEVVGDLVPISTWKTKSS